MVCDLYFFQLVVRVCAIIGFRVRTVRTPVTCELLKLQACAICREKGISKDFFGFSPPQVPLYLEKKLQACLIPEIFGMLTLETELNRK